MSGNDASGRLSNATWAILVLVTVVNVGAALFAFQSAMLTVRVSAEAKADFRAAAAPIAQMGAAILKALTDRTEEGRHD